MATGVASGFQIYEAEFQSGMAEIDAQNSNAFNAASQGAIRLISARHRGQYKKDAFFDLIATTTLITRRDTTSVSAAADTPLVQDQVVGVKVKRKIGPVGHTIDAFRTIGLGDERRLSLVLGRMVQKAKQTEMVNTALKCLEAAIDGQSALNYDGTAAVLTHAALVNGLALFGDNSAKIRLWAMHSAPWFDLMGQSIASTGFDGIATNVINNGVNATLGIPALVTDATDLLTGAGSTLQYQVLGLVPGACIIEESEQSQILTEIELGKENMIARFQGEYAYTITLKGFQWDITNGGANPNAAALATSTNWDKVATQDKELAGVHIGVKA